MMDSDARSNPADEFNATRCFLNSTTADWTTHDGCDATDVYSVERFLATPVVQHLFSIVDVVSRCNPANDSSGRSAVASQAAEATLVLRRYPYFSEAAALCEILENTHIQALFNTYDAVLNRSFEPEIPSDFPEVDEDENVAVKIIELVKNVPHIGTTLRLGDADDEVSCHTQATANNESSFSNSRAPSRLAHPNSVSGTPQDRQSKRSFLHGASTKKESSKEGYPHHNLAASRNDQQKRADEQRLFVARVMHGGVADRSKLIEVGDELVAVNGMSSGDCDPLQLLRTMNECIGSLRLTLVPQRTASPERSFAEWMPSHQADHITAANLSSMLSPIDLDSSSRRLIESATGAGLQNCLFVKALFKYVAEEDTLIPCREAGLSFERGEILRVVDTSDQNWWQAQKLQHAPTGTPRTGLIPGRALLEKRERFIRTQPQAQQFLKDASLTYETLVRWKPNKLVGDKPRVLVLVGADGVGKGELRKQLIAIDPQHFAAPKLFVVRDKNDLDSKRSKLEEDPVFEVSQFEFERLKNEGQFVERGTLRQRMLQSQSQSSPAASRFPITYGLAFSSMDATLGEDRVPIVCLRDASALRLLRSAKYKPFVIFVQPPSLAVLIETRLVKNEAYYREMIASSGRIATSYAHLFDACIVNDDLPVALEQLREVAFSVETHEHWLSADWLTTG